MRRRTLGQLSFLDGAAAERESGRRDGLSEIARVVDGAPIERLADGLHRRPTKAARNTLKGKGLQDEANGRVQLTGNVR